MIVKVKEIFPTMGKMKIADQFSPTMEKSLDDNINDLLSTIDERNFIDIKYQAHRDMDGFKQTSALIIYKVEINQKPLIN